MQPVSCRHQAPAAIGGALTLLGAGAVRPGDLLRLRYLETGLTALVAVGTAKTEIGSSPTPASSELLRLSGRALWFMPAVSTSLPEPATQVTLYAGVEGRSIPLIGAADIDEAGAIRMLLPLKRMDAPAPGALLRIDGARPIWMLVQAAHEHAGDVLGQPAVEVVGAGLRWLPVPPVPPAEIPVCERLRLELHARVGDADPLRLGELDFVAGAARFWGRCPPMRSCSTPRSRRCAISTASCGGRHPRRASRSLATNRSRLRSRSRCSCFPNIFCGRPRRQLRRCNAMAWRASTRVSFSTQGWTTR